MDVPKCAKIVRKMRQSSMKETQSSGYYRNTLKNREFDEEVSQNLDPERMTIAERQRQS